MNNLIDFDQFELNEGKLSKVERFGNFIKYGQEVFPSLNYPKPYVGKKNYKYRVLASLGDTVKPINFGSKTKKVKPLNRLNKEYWENIPYYK